MSTALNEYYEANKERYLDGLFHLLRIPSISTLPEHKPDIQHAAEFLAGDLREMGMKSVEIIAGIDASTITSLGEWKLVIPLAESTMASSGRCS